MMMPPQSPQTPEPPNVPETLQTLHPPPLPPSAVGPRALDLVCRRCLRLAFETLAQDEKDLYYDKGQHTAELLEDLGCVCVCVCVCLGWGGEGG